MIQAIGNYVASYLGHNSVLINRFRPMYESVLNIVNFGRGIPWSINGVPTRIDAHYRGVMWKSYDPAVAAYLRTAIKPGAVCFDIGANLGIYVVQFAEWSKPTGKIVAFEPNPSTESMLRQHIAMNRLSDRVVVVNEAVSDECGQLDFYAANCSGMSRLGAPNRLIADTARAIQVSVTTVDNYVAQSGLWPDAMLIDVEGFEINVLKGARRTLSSRRNLVLVVEMHPNVWASAGTDLKQAEALLKELHLGMEPLTGQRSPLEEHGLVRLYSTGN